MDWIAVSADLLAGKGLAPYPVGELAGLFDWAEDPSATSVHAVPYAGDFLVDIVSIEPNAVHQASKPDDEIVVVLDGVLELTDDGGGSVQSFASGEIVLIPKGWAGIYRCIPGEKHFLELAIVPYDYFEPAAHAPSGLRPRRIVLTGAGTDDFHRGRYAVAARGSGAAWHGRIEQSAEQVIVVTAGSITLAKDDLRDAFGAGTVLIMPRGLECLAETSADYRALALTWLG